MQREHRRAAAFGLLLLLALAAGGVAVIACATDNGLTITATAGAHGSIDPSGRIRVEEGSDRTFTITPVAGYRVEDVVVDGSSAGAVSSYTFTRIATHHTIAVAFVRDPNTVVVAATDSPHHDDPDFVCDGTADQIDIHDAISRFEGATGTVHLLGGTFHVDGSILMHDNITLQGDGDATLVRLSDNSNCDVIASCGGRYERRSDVTIRSLTIDGNKACQTDGSGIYLRGNVVTYEHLTITNCRVRGLSHTGGSHVTVANNVIRDCEGRGIFVYDTSHAEIRRNNVRNCGLTYDNAEYVALDLWYGEHNAITGNRIEGGGLVRQLEARDTVGGVDITGNTLVDGLCMGIAPHARYARIVDNVIIQAGNNAIDTCGETDCWIENNTISRVSGGSENVGIALNSKRSTVINNYIELCGRSGIQLGPDCNDNQILNNVIKNCGQQETMGKAGIWLQVFDVGRPLVITNNVIRGNVCTDDQPAKTQRYGIMLTVSTSTGYIDGVVIADNDLRGNATAAINAYDPALVLNVHIENNLT